MKLRFIIIGPDLISQVQSNIEILQCAVNEGDMQAMDEVTSKLLELTVGCTFIDLSENDWRKFLSVVRKESPQFDSSYLLPSKFCTSLFPTITSDSYVLELPIDTNWEELNV